MRWHRAPAKLNLTLRVTGRRLDGFHDLESVVAFADVCDWLGFAPGPGFELSVEGPGAAEIGPSAENLVARAARALAARFPGLVMGRFRLVKRLPAAAGLGGGSSDAAACLRALAEANGLSLADDRVREAALETGSDVPVCLTAHARSMAGTGEHLGPPLRIPALEAVLVNPRRAVATREVFEALGLERGGGRDPDRGAPSPDSVSTATLDALELGGNDLEPAAQKVLPMIGDILDRLRRLPRVKFARMSGSGATCFAIFDAPGAARDAQASLTAEYPGWWIAATRLR
ncbi:4-(cytidine 5'-diphospho)-2-C-methyl-D-erythritol kinase [Roseiarcus sp.]|uniref:4-(cytidine 5'-diphospho)-2-C-methyl-D-erythritol kinase n=1 Tax=Roseiarcus sp. TaxID=1969460 RepID=UPI003F9996EA